MCRISQNMAQLSCPKCDAPLRRFERSRVVIERCTNCRGVFLDPGELEQLIEMEGTSARPGGKRKLPVTERILDLG